MSIEPNKFTVADMTCNHCVATVTKALNAALPGAMVQIDLPKHAVQVAGNAAIAAQAIRDAGYTPEPA